MAITNLQFLDGQKIHINGLNLHIHNNMYILELVADVENKSCLLKCYNISKFRIDDISFPATISGFEVIDNLENGWQSDVRYKVCDFEENLISFYCEDIEVECIN